VNTVFIPARKIRKQIKGETWGLSVLYRPPKNTKGKSSILSVINDVNLCGAAFAYLPTFTNTSSDVI